MNALAEDQPQRWRCACSTPGVRWSYALTVLAVTGVVLVPGPPVYLFVALTSAGL